MYFGRFLRRAPRARLARVIAWFRARGLLRTPRLLRTSSFRLTLLYAGLFSISVSVLFGIVYWFAANSISGQIDSAVASELAEEQADAGVRGLEGLQELIKLQAQHASPGTYYLLEDESGRILAGNLPSLKPVIGIREWRLGPGQGVRGRGVRIDGGYLFAGLSDYDVRELEEVISGAFLWVFVGSIGLAFAVGGLMSVSVLGRVEAISRASRRIVAGDLSERIAIRGTNDEFDHLASSLNTMLDRIQSLMEGLRQISSDIAHDLRTPLSRHRQRLELAQLHGRTADELREALGDSIQDVDGILETFGALLRIAKIGSAAEATEFVALDLGELVEDVVEAYRAVAEEQGRALSCHRSEPLPVCGSRELLVQLFANMVENALRHTPAGSAVSVSTAMKAGAAAVCVRDTGPGIPAEFREKVFRPFYRLEASRTTPGTGLGLSLVAAIADMHGARIELSDGNPGLCVRLSFPVPSIQTAAEPWWRSHVLPVLQRWLPSPLAAWTMDLLDRLARHTEKLLARIGRWIRP